MFDYRKVVRNPKKQGTNITGGHSVDLGNLGVLDMVETISTGDFMVYVFIFNHLWDDGDQCLGTWLNHHVGGFFP